MAQMVQLPNGQMVDVSAIRPRLMGTVEHSDNQGYQFQFAYRVI